MYLHIGGNYIIPFNDLIAIFDLTKLKKQDAAKEFLNFSQESCVVKIGYRKEKKSVILTKKFLYYSPISSSTLLKRAQNQKLF